MCTKRRYRSRAEADQKVSEIHNKDKGDNKKPIRSYFCNQCGGYHLTSQPLTKDKKAHILKVKKSRPEKIAEQWISKQRWNDEPKKTRHTR